jgi:SNF2 family DNA or RNA helicase
MHLRVADDMGLGKTLTTISLILKSKQSADNDKIGAASGQDGNQWLSKCKYQTLCMAN